MGVLLLNASYEPLRVIPFTRAVNLVLQEKADIVEAREDPIVSSGGQLVMERPDVIRLRYYVKVPYKVRVPLNNRAVLNRDRFTCVYCDGKATTVDHVHPKAKGGAHDWENVVAACSKCNSIKSDKLLSDLGWELPFAPMAPEARTWITLTSEPRESWKTWLQHH